MITLWKTAGGSAPGRKTLFFAALILLLGLAGAGFFLRAGSTREPWRPGLPIDKDSVKIAVLHVSNVSDTLSGYTYAHKAGLLKTRELLGLRDDQIIQHFAVSDLDQAATEYTMRDCVTGGANIVIATSWWHMETCEKLAAEYPNVIFVNATGVKRNAVNFTNYFGRIYQARYLSGIVAGLKTKTGKIGYVTAIGKSNAEVTSGLNAFAMGVEKANPEARVYARLTHRWYDPDGERRVTRALVGDGCDVIAQHSNTGAPQVEAQRAGVWGIGYNSDMKADAPGAVITSVVWNWDIYYTQLLRSVIDGTFTTEPYYGDLGDGFVDMLPPDPAMLPPESIEAVNEARRLIEEDGFGVFVGPMRTNDGRTVGAEGQTLSDEEIRNDMPWYYHNIVEP